MIVVFDVDGTLLKSDSLILAARKSRSIIGFVISTISFIPLLIPWKLKLISDEKLKEEFVKSFKICEKFNEEEKKGNKNWFMKILMQDIRKEAIERINYHKSNGDEIILCSASFDMLLSPLAEFLEIQLISTKLYKKNGFWLPLILGRNCKGKNKLHALVMLKGPIDTFDYEAYGNSIGDKELLENSLIPHFRNFTNQKKFYPEYPLNTLLIIMGLTFLGYGFFNIFNNNNIFYLLNKSYSTILNGISLILLGYFVRFIRWRLIFSKLEKSIPIFDDFLNWMGSYTFTATPGKAGEGVRAILLKKKYGTSISRTLAAIIFERIIDGISVIFIVLLNLRIIKNFNLFQEFNLLENFNYLYPFLIFLFLIIFIFKRNILKIFKILFNSNLFYNLKDLIISLRMLFSLKLFLLTIPLGVFSWGLEGLSLWLLIKEIGNYNITLIGSTFAHTTSGVIGVLSMIPGGIGSTEFSLISLLSLQGLPLDISSFVSILIRLMTIWFATLLGVICLFVNRLKN